LDKNKKIKEKQYIKKRKIIILLTIIKKINKSIYIYINLNKINRKYQNKKKKKKKKRNDIKICIFHFVFPI